MLPQQLLCIQYLELVSKYAYRRNRFLRFYFFVHSAPPHPTPPQSPPPPLISMEVASPLTAFPHGQGKKRPFGFSPSPVHAADAEMGEQSCASEAVVAACGSAPPSAKRRRRLSTDRAAADSAANGSPFGALPAFGVHAGSSSAYGASRTHGALPVASCLMPVARLPPFPRNH